MIKRIRPLKTQKKQTYTTIQIVDGKNPAPVESRVQENLPLKENISGVGNLSSTGNQPASQLRPIEIHRPMICLICGKVDIC